MTRFLLVLVCLVWVAPWRALGQQAPPVSAPPSQPEVSPGTLTLPLGTICHADNVTGRPVCVMPPDQPSASASIPVSAAPTPVPPRCPSFYAAGAAYTLNGSPKWTGWAAVATLFPGIECDPKSGFQPRLVAQHVAKFERVNGTETIVSTTTMEVAWPLQKLGPINSYVLGGIGPAVQGSTAAVKLGTVYGAVATVPLKWGLLLTPALQWVNGGRSFWIGVGRTF